MKGGEGGTDVNSRRMCRKTRIENEHVRMVIRGGVGEGEEKK